MPAKRANGKRAAAKDSPRITTKQPAKKVANNSYVKKSAVIRGINHKILEELANARNFIRLLGKVTPMGMTRVKPVDHWTMHDEESIDIRSHMFEWGSEDLSIEEQWLLCYFVHKYLPGLNDLLTESSETIKKALSAIIESKFDALTIRFQGELLFEAGGVDIMKHVYRAMHTEMFAIAYSLHAIDEMKQGLMDVSVMQHHYFFAREAARRHISFHWNGIGGWEH